MAKHDSRKVCLPVLGSRLPERTVYDNHQRLRNTTEISYPFEEVVLRYWPWEKEDTQFILHFSNITLKVYLP